MAPSLTQKTGEHIATLFSPEHRSEAARLLENECGRNLPLCGDKSDPHIERLRFAALKLSAGNIAKLNDAINIAKRDWRDLLVWSGFGTSLEAHLRWDPAAETPNPQPKD
jgi:hypothetical protein